MRDSSKHISGSVAHKPTALQRGYLILRIGYALAMSFAIIHFILVVFVLLGYPPILQRSLLYSALFGVFGCAACYYFGWKHPEYWISPLVLVAFAALIVVQSWDFFFKQLRSFIAFWPIGVVQFHVSLILIVCVLWSLPHYGLLIRRHFRDKTKPRFPFLTNLKEKPVIEVGFLIVILGTGTFIALDEIGAIRPAEVIELTPQDYEAEFAFWAMLNPDAYTEVQRDALDRHSALLIHFDVAEWYEEGEPSQQNFIEWTTFWRDNYPNVRIMPVVHGLPGRFIWDGCAEASIRLAHRIIRTVMDNNLSNVIGLHTDQEDAHDVLYEDKLTSYERNARADELWEQFFEEVETLYPNRFEFQTTFARASFIDPFDGDRDLDVYVRNNVLSIEGWDEFAPMIYVGSGPNYIPGILEGAKYHYDLYMEMEILYEALSLYGWEDRIGVYLGITNMSIFGNDTLHEFNGIQGNGFDALVTQGLIAKHYGCPRLTIFILNTVEGKGGHLMGGVFESYGDDFLDRYNASVNGENSTDPIQLPVMRFNNHLDYVQLDFWLNFETVFYYLAVITICVASQIYLHKKAIRKDTESKITDKNENRQNSQV